MSSRLERLPPELTIERLKRTMVVTVRGVHSPLVPWATTIAAASTGIGAVVNDYHGTVQPSVSHLCGSYAELVAAISRETQYHYLDSQFLEEDYAAVCQGDIDPTYLVIANAPQDALAALPPRRAASGRVLWAIVGPGAAYVELARNVEVARARIASIQHLGTVPPGPRELAMVAAGTVVHEATLRSPGPGNVDFRPLAYYAPHCPRRVDVPHDLADVHAAASTPMDNWAHFGGKKALLIGASGLGSPIGVLIAADKGVDLTVLDRGRVKRTNLNRTFAYTAEDIGAPKGVAFARQAERFNPTGQFQGAQVEILAQTDIPSTARWDAIVCAPDNDPVRVQAARAARGSSIVYATGATSPTSGYVVVQTPGGPCFECQTQTDTKSGDRSPPPSCMQVEPSVCASNVITAGTLVAELRNALGSVRAPQKIRFHGGRASGNYLVRKATPAACAHGRAEETLAATE
jgi:adenylyltransferase/sulfurtransferase